MYVTHHRGHLFDDHISIEGGVVSDRGTDGILQRDSVDRVR